MLGFVSLGTVLALSVWFSTNAVGPALETEKSLSAGHLSWLTIAVQAGFVAGTLVSALLNLADRLHTRGFFAGSAVVGALLNAAVVPLDDFGSLLVVRFGTGAVMAGVYPVGMRIVSGWFQSARGAAIGTMIGALTLGSGSPHLLRSAFVGKWETTVLGASLFAALGGALVFVLVRDGPFDVSGGRFDPRSILSVVTDRAQRLTLLGYLGHMWELYAMWAWIGAYLVAVHGTRTLSVGGGIELASVLAFAVFAAGAVGCVAAGIAADRYGRTMITSVAMALSGGSALVIGFVPFEWTLVIMVVVLVWGASVVADSAQFSTAITELTDPRHRGTALTFQTGLGFALTAVTIWLVPVLVDAMGWGVAWAMLAVGPALGTVAMLRLRGLPESVRLAGGRR